MRTARLVVEAAEAMAFELAGEGAAPRLELTGYADAPLAAGDPARAGTGADFGVIRPGGRATRTFRIRSVGRVPLHVSPPACEGVGASWFEAGSTSATGHVRRVQAL